jgi:hypothetical protein
MHLYTVLWVVVATVFCMLSQKRQLPRRYAIAGHEPVEVYPESFGRIEVKPISNWRGWGGTAKHTRRRFLRVGDFLLRLPSLF